MATAAAWGKQEASKFLDDTLDHINHAREQKNPVGRCNYLFNALNKTYGAFFGAEQAGTRASSRDRRETALIIALFQQGIGEPEQLLLCSSDQVAELARLTPLVMDHDVLRRADYDPESIPVELRDQASIKHAQFKAEHRSYVRNLTLPEARDRLLEQLARLLYLRDRR